MKKKWMRGGHELWLTGHMYDGELPIFYLGAGCGGCGEARIPPFYRVLKTWLKFIVFCAAFMVILCISSHIHWKLNNLNPILFHVELVRVL